jgi:hypothetical protein
MRTAAMRGDGGVTAGRVRTARRSILGRRRIGSIGMVGGSVSGAVASAASGPIDSASSGAVASAASGSIDGAPSDNVASAAASPTTVASVDDASTGAPESSGPPSISGGGGAREKAPPAQAPVVSVKRAPRSAARKRPILRDHTTTSPAKGPEVSPTAAQRPDSRVSALCDGGNRVVARTMGDRTRPRPLGTHGPFLPIMGVRVRDDFERPNETQPAAQSLRREARPRGPRHALQRLLGTPSLLRSRHYSRIPNCRPIMNAAKDRPVPSQTAGVGI